MNPKQLTAHKSALQRGAHASVGKRPERPSHAALPAGRGEDASGRQADGSPRIPRIIRRLLLPFGVTAVSGAVFVTALTAAAYQAADPTAWILPLSAASLGLASLAGGITAGKCSGEGAVGGSLISGCLLAALLCAVALLGPADAAGISAAGAWLLRLSPIPLHLAGGLLVRPRKRSATHTAGKHPAHRR